MATPAQITTQFNCTQCGGELHPDEGQIFLTCPFCSATVYLDRSRVVFHWYVAPTLDEGAARGALFRWMSGSQTVKDLDRKARVLGHSFEYFPLWYYKHRDPKGESVTLQPAAATSISELASLRLPAGDLRRYDDSLDSQAHPPSVPLQAGLEWLKGRGSNIESISETALVHVPVFIYKYDYQGQTFTTLVDAASGTVLANRFPAKSEAPYWMVGGVTALLFLCLALFPIMGLFVDEEVGLMIGLAVCSGVGVLAAPFLFMWAFVVASKV
jgi:predicted RNA-binding Zn-ribbon protein involved in translation (DUF1610 family)